MLVSDRLQKLAAADDGFFVLALHSRAEALMKERLGIENQFIDFGELVRRFLTKWIEAGNVVNREPFYQLKDEHFISNAVRHEFKKLSSQEAMASAKIFYSFLQELKLEHEVEFRAIPQLFRSWDDHAWTFVPVSQFKNLKEENTELKSKNKDIFAKYTQLKDKEDKQTLLNIDVQRQQLIIADLEKRLKHKDSKYDEKRTELAKANFELQRLLKDKNETAESMQELAGLRQYLNNVKRMALYSQTRRAHERQLMRLTPEQEALATQLPLDRDTLIRGSAGTGKSLVLIRLLGRILTPPRDSLDFGQAPAKVILLTYTKSLTKYNLYISKLFDTAITPETIVTVDSYLLSLVKKAGLIPYSSGWQYAWDSDTELKAQLKATPLDLTPAELKKELDDLIWGWGLTLDEYLDFERKGFKKPLGRKERLAVWSLNEELIKTMSQKKLFSPAYLLLQLKSQLSKLEAEQVDYLLLDEAQDLSPVKLEILHSIAKKGFIAAGDSDQSLYQSLSPFARAGIDIRGGKTRVLHTNFRNTEPIHRFAETLRARKVAYDQTSAPQAFRDGPSPEVTMAENGEALKPLFLQKLKVYLEEFEYEPETILVLHPDEKSGLNQLLEDEGIQYKNLADEDFDFAQSKGVRLTKFPSAKGLDFPVVLVYWHHVFSATGLGEDAKEVYLRNLLYVASTRAMEHLDIFVGPSDPFAEELEELGRGE